MNMRDVPGARRMIRWFATRAQAFPLERRRQLAGAQKPTRDPRIHAGPAQGDRSRFSGNRASTSSRPARLADHDREELLQ
jgi:hypothetical protein